MNTFFHAGQLGDLVYALPTIRALGGGKLITSIRKERHDSIATLLRLQPYITDIAHDPDGRMFDWMRVPAEVTHDLNSFRKREYSFDIARKSLVWSHGRPFDLDLDGTPWLSPAPEWARGRLDLAIVSRSPRYHSPTVNWSEELKRLRGEYAQVAFVGSEPEWAAFLATDPEIPLLRTPTILDLARSLYESRYFAGNQSLPLSLAIGFGLSHSIEVAPTAPNCSFPVDYQRKI